MAFAGFCFLWVYWFVYLLLWLFLISYDHNQILLGSSLSFTLANHQQIFRMLSEKFKNLVVKMLLLLLLDKFPVPCTEPNDLILNRFLAGKCFVVKFALLYLSSVSHVSLTCNNKEDCQNIYMRRLTTEME